MDDLESRLSAIGYRRAHRDAECWQVSRIGAAHPTPRNRPATRPKDLARSPVLRLWLRRLDVFDRPSPYRIRRAI